MRRHESLAVGTVRGLDGPPASVVGPQAVDCVVAPSSKLPLPSVRPTPDRCLASQRQQARARHTTPDRFGECLPSSRSRSSPGTASEDHPSLVIRRRLFECIPDGSLLEGLRTWRGHGRNDYPVASALAGDRPDHSSTDVATRSLPGRVATPSYLAEVDRDRIGRADPQRQ